MELAAALLALTASIGYGLSDVLAVQVVRRHTVSSLALWVQLIGLAVLLLATLISRPDLSPAAMLLGAGAGVMGATGALAFYTALQNGQTSIVAPISATGVLIPVAAGLVAGEPLSAPVLAGVVALVVGVFVIALSQGGETTGEGRLSAIGTPGRSQAAAVDDGCTQFEFKRPEVTAVALSVAAAISFGSCYSVIDLATAASPDSSSEDARVSGTLLVALAVQVGALAVTILAATRHTMECMRPTSMLLVSAAAIGLLDVMADVLITFAIASGPVAVVGPLGSLDPVVTVLAAALFFREPISPTRLSGVAICGLGVALIAL